VAKRLDLPYQSGERTGMQKVKRRRSADCVVGGFRYASGSRVVGSLLLGLYDAEGLLHHVGFTSGFPAATRQALLTRLKPLIAPPGFTGRAPGGPSRWSTERSAEWEPLEPTLVVEVSYDHFTGDRFRHATRFLRWRPDKAPRQCTLAQVAPSSPGPGLPGSAMAPPPDTGAGSRRRASSTSRRSSAGSRRRAGKR
jgi:ATP-dependent DNA ligase